MVLLAVSSAGANAQDLTLRMPLAMIEQGFDKQILPRFGFKHRIRIASVTGGEADMALSDAPGGFQVFSDTGGTAYFLSIETGSAEGEAKARTFLDWLRSGPGKAAIEGFAPDGAPLYSTEVRAVLVEQAETFDGDKEKGARLALVHCGRCHVVDERNRMGGIGSTPSFPAMRGRENWSELFRSFYAENPHPSFTQVEGVTEPFDPNRQIHVAPVEITLDEIEAIVAFIDTLEPKNLGQRVRSQ